MIISLHNERCGGTSLEKTLTDVYGATLFVVDSVNRNKLFARLLNPPLPHVIHGHLYYGIHAVMGEPCEYVTVLREPVSRYMSHLRWQYEHEYKDEDFDIERLIQKKSLTPLQNLVTRRLTGKWWKGLSESDYELAAQILKTFTLIGKTADFGAFLAGMAERFNWYRYNEYEGHKMEEEEELSSDIVPLIRTMNEYDIRLYESVE